MLLRNKIEDWLNKYDITNYELIEDEEYGYIINVNSNVYLNGLNLSSINVKFNIVNSDFNCYYN